MPIKKSELCSAFWKSCDELRGGMDAEIAALELRRDKTRALKPRMMPELLTGRTPGMNATDVNLEWLHR